MNRRTTSIIAMGIFFLIALGCSSAGTSPTSPDVTSGQSIEQRSNAQLWGYYDLYFDFENKSVEAVANRSVAFTANVVTFINPNPAGLAFTINSTPVGTGYIDVDLDVKISHPLNLAAYNGYDVKGIFVANGSGTMAYDSQLKYGKKGVDQILMNADGYTRWFNKVEFTIPGVLGYTQGTFASAGYNPTATLNGYKYFAKGLTATGDLWNYLTTTTSEAGYFLFGTNNTRNYQIRFPMPDPGVKYGYAIAANWKGEDPGDHPAYAVESPGINVTVTPDIYYVDNSNKGGDLEIDVDIFGWDYMPSTVTVESTVFTSPATFDLSTETPTGGDENYSTYHFEIPANNITGTTDQEFWVICTYSDFDYSNTFGVSNGAGTDPLAAFFRYDLFVANEPYHTDPLCDLTVVTPMPHNGDGKITFNISGTTYYDGATFASASWDFNGDGTFGDTYDTGTQQNPTKNYTANYVGNVCVRITDSLGGESTCCKPVNITYNPLWKEDFTNPVSNWYFGSYMWEPCTDPGAPARSTTGPFGPSGSGAIRFPTSGNYMDGGNLATVVTPPFAVPSGYTEVNLRVYFAEQFGGSWGGWYNSNWKIVESSTPGLSPFVSGAPASLPPGGAYLNNTLAHGSALPQYAANPCNAYSACPLYGQPGWAGTFGGGAFPASLSSFFDLVIPSTFYGKTVKVCFQFQPDECGYAGSPSGFAMDDFEVKVY